MIEAVLCLQALSHTLRYGLHDDDRGIEICFLIHLPNNPIYESAKEVALAKLYNALRALYLKSGGAVEFLHFLSLLRYYVITTIRISLKCGTLYLVRHPSLPWPEQPLRTSRCLR